MTADLAGIPNCAFHSDVDSSGQCVSCGRYLCDRCIELVNGAELCKLCKERMEAARHHRMPLSAASSPQPSSAETGLVDKILSKSSIATGCVLMMVLGMVAYHGVYRKEGIPPWTMFGFMALVAVIVIVWSRRRKKLWEELFKSLALRLDGKCDMVGSFPKLMVPIQGHGREGCFTYFTTGGKHPTLYTDFVVQIAGGSLRLEIYPEGFFSHVGKLFGMQDIRIGDDRLDSEFIIKSDNEATTRQFLSAPDVRAALLELKRLRGNRAISLELSATAFLVRKLSWLEELSDAEIFIQKSRLLFEHIYPAVASGGGRISEPSAAVQSPMSRKAAAVWFMICVSALAIGGWNYSKSHGDKRLVKIAREGNVRLYGVPNEINTLQTLERFMLRKVRAKFIPVDLSDDAAVQALSDRMGKKSFNLPVVDFDGDFRDFRDLANFFREFPVDRPLKPLKKKPYIVIYGPSDCEQLSEKMRELDAAGLPWEFRDLNANPEHPAVAFSRLEAYGWPMDEKVYFPIVDVNGNIWDRPSLEHIRTWYADK